MTRGSKAGGLVVCDDPDSMHRTEGSRYVAEPIAPERLSELDRPAVDDFGEEYDWSYLDG
jgi:hypothetical protein